MQRNTMPAVIRQWGNRPALRLPTAPLKEAGYQLKQRVELRVSQGPCGDVPEAGDVVWLAFDPQAGHRPARVIRPAA